MNPQIPQHIKILPTKKWGDKNPTVLLKNRYVHSKYDPIKEAERIIVQYPQIKHSNLIIILGAGLGYVIEKIFELKKNISVIVIEPEKFFGEYIKNRFPDYPLKIFINEPPDTIIEFFSKNIVITDIKNIVFIQNEALNQIYNEYFDKIKVSILEHFKREIAEITTDAYFSELWFKNTIRNLKNIKHFSFLKDYKNFFKDATAILISPGPSLEKNLKLLKNKNLYKFAIAPAVNLLIKNNIVPDFIITSDANFYNILHLKPYIKESGLTLITELCVRPAILSHWKGKIILFDHNLPISRIIKYVVGEIGYIPMGGTVSVSCLFVLKYMGFKNVYLLGQDFRYINFKTHCKGTGYELYDITRINKFKTLLNCNYAYIKENKIEYIDNDWLTDEKMKMYKNWLEKIIGEFKEIEIKNLSCSWIKGIPNVNDIKDISKPKKEIMYKSYSLEKDLKTVIQEMLYKFNRLKQQINNYTKAGRIYDILNLLVSDKEIYEFLGMVLYIEFLKIRRGIKRIDEEFVRKIINGINLIVNLFEVIINPPSPFVKGGDEGDLKQQM